MKLSTLNPYLYSFLMASVLLLSSCEDNKSDTTPTPTTTEYTVTFDAGTGGTLTSTATVKVKSGEKVAEPTAPTRDGFTLSEWQTANGTAFDFATQTITEDITLTAKWVSNTKYTVTFNLMGGTFASGTNTVQVPDGEKLTEPTAPTKVGSTFAGWQTADGTADGAAFDFATQTITEDITLYAQWGYNLTFTLNGGQLPDGVLNPEVVAENTTPTLPIPTQDGAVFVDWYNEAERTTVYTPAVLTKDTTLYAQWDKTSYSIDFKLNQGTLVGDNPLEFAPGVIPTLPANPTRSGAVFINWFTNADFTDVYTPVTTALSANITLYAQWGYNLTFTLNGGQLPDGVLNPEVVAENTTPTLPVLTKPNAIFINWFIDARFIDVYTPAALTEDLTLYAQWEHDVTLKLNGGTLPTDAQNPQAVKAGTWLSLRSLPQPTKSTYRFLGWYTEAGLTTRYKPEVINAGRTLYARWETKFTVAFDLDGGTLSGRSGDMISKTYREGLVPTLPTDPTKASQSFAGWFTDSGLNNAYTPAALTTNIDLYAQWVDPPFTVSVAIDGNTVAGTISEASKTITFLLPAGIAASDLSALTPSFTEATSSPTTAQDFTGPVTYAVTKTGATQATTYSVKLRVRDKAQLEVLVNALLTAADLNFIDTSLVTDMSALFKNKPSFNGAIGAWDVSNVTTMNEMFNSAQSFNADIGNWDVSQVETMSNMFEGASAFNQDIGNWDVSKVETMESMFSSASAFNRDIGDWDVSKVETMESMFSSAPAFNQDISGWNVGLVTNFINIFRGTTALEDANKPTRFSNEN